MVGTHSSHVLLLCLLDVRRVVLFFAIVKLFGSSHQLALLLDLIAMRGLTVLVELYAHHLRNSTAELNRGRLVVAAPTALLAG